MVKTKYNKQDKTRTLFLLYKPFDFVLMLTKNRNGKNLTVSVNYPESSETSTSGVNKTICDSNLPTAGSLFERLSLSEKCKKTYLTNYLNSTSIERNIDIINRRKCKLENLIGILESARFNASDLMRQKSLNFKEVNISFLDPSKSTFVAEPNEKINTDLKIDIPTSSSNDESANTDEYYYYNYHYDLNQTSKKNSNNEPSSSLGQFTCLTGISTITDFSKSDCLIFYLY